MTSGVIHLIRKPRTRHGDKITACGQPFNKVTMIGTEDLDNVVCRNCQNSRYIGLLRNMERVS